MVEPQAEPASLESSMATYQYPLTSIK